ncbi:MAG: bifunctional DNA primase/polymerase [Dehalococcoidales bacterium]|jgi:hypothetical protein
MTANLSLLAGAKLAARLAERTASVTEKTSQGFGAFIKHYQDMGLSFFPIPYKSKESTIQWKRYQTSCPREDEIRKWNNGAPSNLAVVTGKASGNLVVLDFDDTDRYCEFTNTFYDKTGIGDLFEYTLCVQTSRGVHVWLRVEDLPKSTKLPSLDIKSEGGYVLAPPSVHPTGKVYEFIDPDMPVKSIQRLSDIGIEIPGKLTTGSNNKPGWVNQLLSGVGQGQRNDSAIRLAGYFRNILPQDVTERILLDWNMKNQPPLPENEVIRTVGSAYRLIAHPPDPPNNGHIKKDNIYLPKDCQSGLKPNRKLTENLTKEKPTLSKQIEAWIRKTSGWFSYTEIDHEFDLRSPNDKQNRYMILRRLKEKGVIESHKTNNKLTRFLQTDVRIIDFKSAGNRTPLAVNYPFQIEKLFNTYPGNLIVLAGAPDSGKTAFLLNFIRLNMANFPIYYQSSEMGAIELANRLENFDSISLGDWRFTAEERSSNFSDVIRPDCINIIDYLEFDSGEYFKAGDYLKEIHDKLGTGICLVAMQKNRGSTLGRGGNLGLEKPRLYLTMDNGKIKIQKAKNWATQMNPNGLTLEYKVVKGCQFIVTKDWYKDED